MDRRLALAAAAVLALVPALAHAQTETSGPTFSGRFQPAATKTGAELTFQLGSKSFEAGTAGRSVASVRVTLPRGTTLRPNAVTARCSTAQASQFRCPLASKVGVGVFVAEVLQAGINERLTFQVRAYLSPRGPGERSGLTVLAVAPQRRLIIRGGISGGGSGTGPVLELRNLVNPTPLDSSTVVRLLDADFRFGAKRTVRKRVTTTRIDRRIVVLNGKAQYRSVPVRHTYLSRRLVNLFTTPPSCSGRWTFAAALALDDATTINSSQTVPCRVRRAR